MNYTDRIYHTTNDILVMPYDQMINELYRQYRLYHQQVWNYIDIIGPNTNDE